MDMILDLVRNMVNTLCSGRDMNPEPFVIMSVDLVNGVIRERTRPRNIKLLVGACILLIFEKFKTSVTTRDIMVILGTRKGVMRTINMIKRSNAYRQVNVIEDSYYESPVQYLLRRMGIDDQDDLIRIDSIRNSVSFIGPKNYRPSTIDAAVVYNYINRRNINELSNISGINTRQIMIAARNMICERT